MSGRVTSHARQTTWPQCLIVTITDLALDSLRRLRPWCPLQTTAIAAQNHSRGSHDACHSQTPLTSGVPLSTRPRHRRGGRLLHRPQLHPRSTTSRFQAALPGPTRLQCDPVTTRHRILYGPNMDSSSMEASHRTAHRTALLRPRCVTRCRPTAFPSRASSATLMASGSQQRRHGCPQADLAPRQWFFRRPSLLPLRSQTTTDCRGS